MSTNVAEILSDLTRRGVWLAPNGDRLYVDAPKGLLTPDLLDELRRHKAELLALLHDVLPDTVEDLAEHWNERAAILEYDAGLPRAQAEEQAAAMTATLARNRAYPWQALRLALAERPDLAAQVPDEPGPVDRLLWGPARLAILPSRRVIPQGRVRP